LSLYTGFAFLSRIISVFWGEFLKILFFGTKI